MISTDPIAPRSALDRTSFATRMRVLLAAFLAAAFAPARLPAQTCTTQSGLSADVRTGIASAAQALAADVQSNNGAALRTGSVPEVQNNFAALQSIVASTTPRLAGGTPVVDQVYLLDASTLKLNADNSAPDAQFFCSLNRSTMEADFLIPALPPGRYAFAIVNVTSSATPYRLSFLLRQETGSQQPATQGAAQTQATQAQAKWLLAGFYPRSLVAGGHDGLWYWTHARQFTAEKQPWNAWLYYQAARTLLTPADFVLSTHLDKLRAEATAAAPPALSDGVSVDAPLVVKAADGTEFHFTGLGIDDSLGQSSLDIAAHLRADPLPDPTAARKRNTDAMVALLAAYPELRKPFHGVWIYAESPGQNPFATEQPIADIK